MINDWENIIAYCEDSEQSKALRNKCDSFKNSWMVWGGGKI